MSLLPFILVMDELVEELLDEVLWCMLFGDDIILADETKEELSRKLDGQGETLEMEDFKISYTMTKSNYYFDIKTLVI